MKYNLNLPKGATFNRSASIWKRILAFILDMLIIDFVAGGMLQAVIAKVIPETNFSNIYSFLQNHPRSLVLISLTSFIYGFIALLYFSILEYRTGQTLGKMFFGLRVLSDNKQLTYMDCITRSMYFILTLPFILLFIIDPIFLIFNKEKRRLSEVLSRTRTVEIYTLYANDISTN